MTRRRKALLVALALLLMVGCDQNEQKPSGSSQVVSGVRNLFSGAPPGATFRPFRSGGSSRISFWPPPYRRISILLCNGGRYPSLAPERAGKGS